MRYSSAMSKRRRRMITLIITETWTITWSADAPQAQTAPPTADNPVAEPSAPVAHEQPSEWRAILQWHIEETLDEE